MEVGWGVVCGVAVGVAEADGVAVWEGVEDELDVAVAVGEADGLAVANPDGDAEGEGFVLLPPCKLNPPVAM